MNRKTPILDPRRSVTPDAIDLKLGTRDYIMGATHHAKNRTIGPAGAPRQRGEISCSNVYLFIYLFIYLWFLAQLWRTHFWKYRHRFCVKWRVPVRIDFLGGSQLQDHKFSPPKPQKTWIFRPLFGQKRFIMGRLISKLPLIVTGAP